MGGMRALEWAVGEPERVAGLLLLACPAAASADQIAWATAQIHAIRADPHWRGGDHHDAGAGRGPHTGLGIARRIAHVTYRSAGELQAASDTSRRTASSPGSAAGTASSPISTTRPPSSSGGSTRPATSPWPRP